MSLEKCPKCGKLISKHASKCINCGFECNFNVSICCPFCGSNCKTSICDNCGSDVAEYYCRRGCELFEKNKSAFRSIYYGDEALKCFLTSAKLGNADALNMLGVLYKDGKIVNKDEETAFSYFSRAARQGCNEAQFNLACCYELGIGTGGEIDYNEALKWYLEAAKHHNLDAMFNIGNFYMNGYGVNIDYNKAIQWFEKLGTADAEAQYLIGLCYLNLGITRENLLLAKKHLINAVSDENPDAKEKLGLVMYYLGE